MKFAGGDAGVVRRKLTIGQLSNRFGAKIERQPAIGKTREEHRVQDERPVVQQIIIKPLGANRSIAEHHAESNRAAPAISGHPTAGLREEPDVLLNTALGSFTTVGVQDCRWIDVDEWRQVDWAMERQALEYEITPGRQLTARFFWAADESQAINLTITTDEPHQVLGNGLHFTLTIPLKVSAEHIAQMGLELNENERANWHTSHMLGSWCNHDDSLAFRLFIPNGVYQTGILEQIAVTMATRAIWVTEFFLEKKEQAQMARDATVG